MAHFSKRAFSLLLAFVLIVLLCSIIQITRNPSCRSSVFTGGRQNKPDAIFENLISTLGGLPKTNSDFDLLKSNLSLSDIHPVMDWKIVSLITKNNQNVVSTITDDDPIYNFRSTVQISYEDGDSILLEWSSWHYGIVVCPFVISFGDGPAGTIAFPDNNVYEAWTLAVRYKFEEISGEHEAEPILKAIAKLQGDEIRYFLDSVEAINQVQTTMFPPGSSKEVKPVKIMTPAEERHLVDIVTESVFSKGDQSIDSLDLNAQEQTYVRELRERLRAIVGGDGDTLFSAEYLAYRTKVIRFVEETGTQLFDPSPETLERFLKFDAAESEIK